MVSGPHQVSAPVTYNPSLLFVGKTFRTENDKIAYVNEMKSQKKQSAYESHLKMLYLNLKRNGELLRRVQSGEIGAHALARMKSIDLQVESERQNGVGDGGGARMEEAFHPGGREVQGRGEAPRT